MNSASESTKDSGTLTLTRTALGMLDSLPGEIPKSVFVEESLTKEMKRRKRESFYRTVVASYTWEVRLETLNLNEETLLAEFDYSP